MEKSAPIFTEKNECQDCFKCVRECPVKAVRIENACATVIPQLCMACGHCVGVCPSGAKRVRDDLPRAQELLRSKKRVIVSLAPSFVSEFAGVGHSDLIGALKTLGFMGVSETALGAQQVSGSVAAMLKEPQPRLIVSSACPAIVDYLQKYEPSYAAAITPVASPVLAHCHLLRNIYGKDIGIVFVSPCIAKKREADAHAGVLDVAITFEDLRRWLAQQKISLGNGKDAGVTSGTEDGATANAAFIPEASEEGALYPIDGGMMASVKAGCTSAEAQCMSFSGISAIRKALDGLRDAPLTQPLFLELLACEGGCINGPKAFRRGATAAKRYQIIHYAKLQPERLPRAASAPAMPLAKVEPVTVKPHTEAQIQECLRSIGKQRLEDELNCGGCGYDNCREFATALADGKAERVMCVTYMRKLAQKKANALMSKTPNAVVLVDANLKIIECNINFAQILGPDAAAAFKSRPGLDGTPLRTLLPFHHLFQSVLQTGEDILGREIRFQQSILQVSIFTIEKGQVACAIMQDITQPAVRKERIIQQTQEVIRKNLETVQQIAYLLGENAAESEVMLNAIIKSFSNTDANQNANEQ
ncbi:MAG TPA: [Fe-Fe] hydrogenase large subunit C-terminal domain-containing protein [Planctomycetota bacterium]|jgi:iron only hydrogenase large subunit-like protein